MSRKTSPQRRAAFLAALRATGNQPFDHSTGSGQAKLRMILRRAQDERREG